EAAVANVQRFLPQDTLHDVESATDFWWAAGFRVGWHTGLAFLDDFSVLAEYGQSKYTFASARGPYGGLVADMQQVSGEIVYRPRVASRLRPYFRAGGGAFALTMNVQCADGEHVAFERTNPGMLFGGGIDVLRIFGGHLRFGAGGAYRVLKYKVL